jgi:hypothetical protein
MLRNRKAVNKVPVLETLLQTAHEILPQLNTIRARVISAGIAADNLPGDLELQAFVLLGDHERHAQLALIAPHAGVMFGKGLIDDSDINRLPTPIVRFFEHAEPWFESMLDIAQRFESGVAAWQAGFRSVSAPVIVGPEKYSAIWGQELHLHFEVSNAEWLLVRADSIFGLSETTLPLACAGTVPVTVSIPCDNGNVAVIAMSSTGDVTIHTVQISLLLEMT